MAESLGIVIPAYHPEVNRLRRHITALNDQLNPSAIHVELDAP